MGDRHRAAAARSAGGTAARPSRSSRARCRSGPSRSRSSAASSASACSTISASALARAHHVGRPHRLVGADQHEAARRPSSPASARDDQRAEDVVAHALDRIVLDQRHMLVGGGVVDGVRPPGWRRSSRIRASSQHRGEQRHESARRGRRPARCTLELAMDGVERIFAGIRPAAAIAGRSARICRHSSLPIEPPAPVTSTTLSRDVPLQQRAGRAAPASRPSRSSISSGLRSLTGTWPWARSSRPGRVRTSTARRLGSARGSRCGRRRAGRGHGEQHSVTS